MRLRDGLHARFLAAVVLALLVVLAVVTLVLHRQDVMRREVLALSKESMHALVFDRLAERGEAAAVQLAASLVNPLYYFDLDQIGALLRAVMKQPDVAYAVVYDTSGAVIHDGSGDIATFGQVMDDALAYEAIAGTGPHVQSSDRILDVSTPVRMGDQRLGGLRIGYSVASVADDEARAVQGMSARLTEIGDACRLDRGVDGGAGGVWRGAQLPPATHLVRPIPSSPTPRARSRPAISRPLSPATDGATSSAT